MLLLSILLLFFVKLSCLVVQSSVFCCCWMIAVQWLLNNVCCSMVVDLFCWYLVLYFNRCRDKLWEMEGNFIKGSFIKHLFAWATCFTVPSLNANKSRHPILGSAPSTPPSEHKEPLSTTEDEHEEGDFPPLHSTGSLGRRSNGLGTLPRTNGNPAPFRAPPPYMPPSWFVWYYARRSVRLPFQCIHTQVTQPAKAYSFGEGV